jgi:hypothetical protein
MLSCCVIHELKHTITFTALYYQFYETVTEYQCVISTSLIESFTNDNIKIYTYVYSRHWKQLHYYTSEILISVDFQASSWAAAMNNAVDFYAELVL